MLNAAYLGVRRMASPMCCGFELGNAHSRSGAGSALGRVFVPAFNFAARKQSESLVEREVVPRKASSVHNENCKGYFAVRGRQGRTVGSHSMGSLRASYLSSFKTSWRNGPVCSEFTVVLGSPNKPFKRTPNTPRPAANAFGIFSQQTAPRSAPLNLALGQK